MKKIILSSVFIASFSMLYSQTTEQAKQLLYYKKYQSAEKSFYSVVQENPNDAEAWYGLVFSILHQNEIAKAKQSLQQAPLSVRNRPFFDVALGYILLGENKKDSASFYFSHALNETKEKDAAILSAIASAEIEAKEGNASYALELLDKAIKKDKRNAMLYALKGDAYRKLNNGTEAFKAYQEALNKNDKLALAAYQMGNIFVTQKNPDVYLPHFQKALDLDKNFAPALYALYLHYFYSDPSKAMNYFNQYTALADASMETEYAFTDLLYLNKKYNEAIVAADKLKAKEGAKLRPRVYKLLAYSTAGLGDTAKAIGFMQQYFANEADSNFVAKDFETMAKLFVFESKPDSAVVYFSRLVQVEKDPVALYPHYKTLALFAHDLKDYSAEAKWLKKYYTGNIKAGNIDLFNWGIAHYRAEEYAGADTVFGLYVRDHPEQGFGYYWQARSKAMLDEEMTEGLAVPYYQKLIEVNQTDTAHANYKKWMVEAFGYIAAYNANTKKDYPQAISYFQKLLEVDPENADAKKYISLLEKRGEKDEVRNN